LQGGRRIVFVFGGGGSGYDWHRKDLSPLKKPASFGKQKIFIEKIPLRSGFF
jgi:hypothetical protein